VIFVGEFPVIVDEQNRVTLPTSFQKAFPRSFFISGLEIWGHLTLYPPTDFANLLKRLDSSASPVEPAFIHVLPLIGGSSSRIKTDLKGRFTIPSNLRQFVSNQMVFVGAGRTIRFYKADSRSEQKEQGNEFIKLAAARLAGGGNVKKNR
jgi:DNA-binding transcriptional regulator/RsmH inhibitor MraZ